MADSENKEREGRRAAPPVTPRPGATVRDEAILYGDEGDLPRRRKRREARKAAEAAAEAPREAAAAEQESATPEPEKPARRAPSVAPPKSKRKRIVRQRRPGAPRRGIFELMSATGSDSIVKPIHIFGHEFRFWPVVLLIIVALLISGIVLNNSNLNVAEQTVTVVGLPEDMEGYRIIVLSDMNGRRFGDVQSLLLRTVNGLKYDAIFCLGDMVGKDGDAEPFFEFLEGLRSPEKVYFICGDSDPGPFADEVRGTSGPLSQLVLADWILGAIQRGANYVDAPTAVTIRNSTLWLTPATMLNLEAMDTRETWKNQTEQEEDGVISGINEDYATLPVTTYRYQLAQKLYDAQRTMGLSDVHISLAHERPSDEFLYTVEDHDPAATRYLGAPELLLAGHYCGGVWRLPYIGALFVPDRTLPRNGWFPADSSIVGLSSVGDIQVYITSGLSNNGSVPLMPFRMFNGPQISVLTLTATLPENMLEAG